MLMVELKAIRLSFMFLVKFSLSSSSESLFWLKELIGFDLSLCLDPGPRCNLWNQTLLSGYLLEGFVFVSRQLRIVPLKVQIKNVSSGSV